MINRRDLLAGLGATAALPLVSRASLAQQTPQLITVTRRTLEVKGKAASVYGITGPNGKPGLEMALGTLRRLTGTVKAAGVADALEEELENGLDKVVLMAWHKDVMASLADRLKKYGVVRLDGSTTPQAREMAAKMFQTDPACRVFIGQIVAGQAPQLAQRGRIGQRARSGIEGKAIALP